MKPFFTHIRNLSSASSIGTAIPDRRVTSRGAALLRAGLLLAALLVLLSQAAQAAVGGSVAWQVRDVKTGIQMPTVPTGSAVDSQGNIYVTGYQKLVGGSSGEDYYLIRIKPNGQVDDAWGTKSYNEANFDDRATGIVVDADDNVIVTGNVTMADGGRHIHTAKYSGATGAVLWEHTYEPVGPAHSYDYAAAVAVQGGFVYVAGTARLSGSTNDDILILRYDNGFADGGSHGPVTAVVYDRAGTQDAAEGISVAAGGVAIVGRTWDGSEFDMLTLKYDLTLADATKQAWPPHSSPGGNAPGNNGSWGRFVKVDQDGNVIASGFDISAGSDKDIYTVKYCDNPNPATCNGLARGALIWERRYQGSFADDVKGLALDTSGFVHVTGTASRISSDTDYYTARYNGQTGALLWEAVTDGGSTIDVPTGIVVDNGGDLYVTGYVKLNGVDAIQTHKYRRDATSSRLLWQKTFKNPDNPPGNPDLLDIRATGVGLSSDGVVVVGWANKLSSPAADGGTATAGSATTLQDTAKSWTPSLYVNYFLKIISGANSGQVRPISASGSGSLTVSSPFPAAIAAGDSYEIYSVDMDYYGVRYEKGTLDRPTDLTVTTLSNSSLRLQWSDNSSGETGFKLERCKGKGCDFSSVEAVFTLGAGVTTFDDNDAANTAGGTPLLVPDTYYQYRVRAYAAAPAEESDNSNSVSGLTVFLSYLSPAAGNVFTYDGVDHQEDTSPAVAVGPDNNPVITGRSYLAGDGFDYYTVKLDRTKLNLPAGVLWAARYDGGQYDNDEATCLAVDKDNRVVVAGDSVLPPLGGGDNMNVLMTVLYQHPPAVDGLNQPTHSWSDQYNGPGKLDDHATAVAVDSAGNYAVVGHGKKDGGNHQYLYLVKYNADKSRAWTGELLDVGVNGRPAAVAFAPDGSIYVSGQRHNGTDFDCFTVKFCGVTGTASCNGKAGGQIIWQDFHDSGRGDDYARDLVVDAAGNAYVTGSAVNGSDNRDFYSIRYGGTAVTPVREWEGKGLSVDGSESGEAVALAFDPVNGDLLVAGTVLSDPGNNDFALLRYKTDGTLVWKKVLFRPDNDDDVIGMAPDASGNVFVAGNTSDGSGVASMAIQFDTDGKVLQSYIYTASPANEDKVTSLTVNSLNEAFIAGTTRTSSIDYLLYKVPVWPVQAPAPVTVTPGYTTLGFSWPATSTAAGVSYKGKRADGACSDTSAFGAEFDIPANSYSVSGLPQSTTYCYAFKTTTAASGDSRWITVTATTATPAAPAVTVTPITSTQIDLAWTSTVAGQSGFEVWSCSDSGATPCSNFTLLTTAAPSATGYSHQDVCPGTIYRYQVRAIGSGWSSAFSIGAGGITPTADNLIVDAGIEAADPFASGQSIGWTYVGSTVASEITYDASVKHGGAQSLNINAATSPTQGGIKQYVRFAPGGKYQLSAWFKSAAPAGKVVCDSLDGSSFLIANSGTTSNWEQISQTLTVAAPSASSRLRCFVYTGYQANLDDLVLKPLYDLTATAYSESQINLTWIDSAYDETGYEIWRCKDPDGSTACSDFALLDRVAANITGYGSNGLEPNAKYRYQIRPYKTVAGSCGGGWTGAFSNVAGPVQTLYTKPVLSKTTPTTTQVNLSWTDTTSSESSFLMQRCTGNLCTFDAGHGLVETQLPFAHGKDLTQTWSDTSVCVSTDYQFRVKPVNNGIQSASGCWNKSTPLTITNFKADFITRVKIPGNLAGYAGMKDDFSDIRIYDETARKELPYWIESKSDRNWAIVWFKTGASNNIRFYYDNAAATSTGDLAGVFGSGVKAFYPFGETPFAAGTTYDKSGVGNDLTSNHLAPYGVVDPGASRLSTDSGNVLSAGGVNNRAAYRFTTTLPTGGTASIEAWIYPKSPQTNQYNGIVSFGENLQAQRVYLMLQDNGRPAMLGFNNDLIPASGPQVTFNAWNHIALVLNGTSTATLYLNGQPVSGTLSGGLVPNLQSKYLYVGMNYDGASFNGLIDDVRIYGRALTAGEIASRYAAVPPTVTVGPASGSAVCQTFSGGWGDDSFYSNPLPVSMAAPVPPTTLNVTAVSEARVDLSWKDKTSDETEFEIYRCVDTAGACTLPATATYTVVASVGVDGTVTFSDTTGLEPGKTYRYGIKAHKSGSGVCEWRSGFDTAPTKNWILVPLNAPSGVSRSYSFSSSCNDLRFTDSDGSTNLSYWIEGGCNTSATKAWLKFPSLPAGTRTIYQYHGNPSAAAPTMLDPATLFDFYDDFAGTTLNAAKWTKYESAGTFITQNNGLQVSGGSGYWGATGMYSTPNFNRPFVLEFSHYRSGGGHAMVGVKNNSTPATHYNNLVYGIYPIYDGNGNRLIVYQDGASSADNLKPSATNAWQYFKIEVPATGAGYFHGSAPVPSAMHPLGYTQFYSSSSTSTNPLRIGMDIHSQIFTIGSVKLRKYASPEPSLTLLSEQAGSFLGGAWKYQRQYSINNATGGTLTNYQLPVYVDTTPLAVDQIKVSWTNNTTSENGYIIERCDNTASGGTCASSFAVEATFNVSGTGLTSYIDRSIKSNNAYCYRISATRSAAPSWTTAATAPVCEPARQQQVPALSAVGTTTQIKLDWTETDFAAESRTATAGSTTTLTDSTRSWATNQWVGYYLKITSGAASGQAKQITGNTATVITVGSAFSAAVASGNSYQIVPSDGYGGMMTGIFGKSGYEIERCQDSGSGCTPAPLNPRVLLGPNAAKTYTDQLCSGAYNYRVHVLKYDANGALRTAADGWPEYSNTVSAAITSAPAPTKVKAVRASEAEITLTWQDNTGDETGFNIYRCKDVGGVACTDFALVTSVPAATGTASGSPAGTGTTVTFSDTRNIAPDSTYRYQVKAAGTGALCPTWETLAGTPDPVYASGDARATTTTSAPSDLSVLAGNTTQVNVNWNDTTASEGALILERCTGVGCSDFGYLSNLSSSSAPASRSYKAFYPFIADLKDTSGNGLDLVNAPASLTPVYRSPNFNDGLYLCYGCDESFQSPVTGALNSEFHAIEFDFKIRSYNSVRTKVFGYTVATATPDKSSPGIYLPPNNSGYGLIWVYANASGGTSEVHIGVNGIGDSSTAFTANQWYHIRGEKAGNSFKVYLNGTLIGSTTVLSPHIAGNVPLTFGRDATTTAVAAINLKNFSIDGNIQSADTSECAGTTYSYRTRAVRDGFASSRVSIANFLPNFATRVVIPATMVAGRSASQINDIRFYDSTAKAEIPYWLEGVSPDGSAIVWIKTGANNTITLYSNKNATSVASASNGARVFDFFDDFSYASASDPSFTSRWGVSTGGTAAVSGGRLNVTVGAVYSQNAVGGLATPLGKVFETKNSWTTATAGGSGLTVCNSKETYSGNGTPYYAHADLRLSGASGLQAVAGDGSISGWNVLSSYLVPGTGIPANSDVNIAGQDRIIGVEYQSATNLTFYSKDPNTYQPQYLPPSTSFPSVWNPAGPTAPYLFFGHIWGSNAAAGAIYPINVDWVRVRSSAYPNPEPLGTIDAGVAFPAELTAWKASAQVLIANFQPNYQTRLTVAKSTLMNNDFSDLRFYDTTAQVLLPHYVESTTDGVSATVWVKTGATNTIALYYGNSGATSTAVNASAMFELFDDFTTIDAGRWSKSNAGADITVDGSGSGTVRINGGALVSSAPIVSNPQNYAFEMKSYLVAPTTVWFSGLTVANTQTIQPSNGGGNAVARLNFNTSGVLQTVGADGTVASNNLTSPNLDNSADYVGPANARIIGIGFPGSGPIRFFSRNPDSYLDKVPSVALNGTWQSGTTTAHLILGHVFGLGGAAIDTSDLVVDWVRARRYAYPEPQASVNTGQFPNSLNPGIGGSGSWSSGSLLTVSNFQPNFQFRMTVPYQSGMQTDFRDIRFYDTTARIELPHWIETYTSGSTATVWLKTGLNATIALYYGNSQATTTSNGSAVFEFFDDFTTLDSARWSKSDPAAGITVDGSGSGKVRINSGAIYSTAPLVATPMNWVYEMKSQWTGAVTNYSQLTVSDRQHFLSGNSGASAYATSRLQNTGSLYAQAADGTSAANNVTSEAYPLATSPYTMAPLNSESIIGLEFQGTAGKISYFSKNPTTYVDLARLTKASAISLRDTGKNRSTSGWTYGGGYYVKILSGANYGLTSGLASYTSNSVSVSTAFPNFFSVGDTYEVRLNNYHDLVETGTMTGLWNSPMYLWLGSYLGAGTGTANGGTADNTDLIVDWVRIRKYAATQPSAIVSLASVNQAPAPDMYQFLNNWVSPYSSTITVATPQVANLATNSDFETGLEKWTVGAGASEDTGTAASGMKSLKISKALAQGTSELASLPLPQLLPGGSYTLSGHIKANLTNGYAFCRVAVNNTSWDSPLAEYDVYSPAVFVWNKTNNSIPDNSNTSSSDGRIPLGLSTGGAGLSTSPYGTPTDRGDTGALLGAAVIKEGAGSYRMWYSGNDHGTGGAYRIYHATSTNGIDWVKGDTTLPPVQDAGVTPTGNKGWLPLGSDVSGIGDRLHVLVSPAVIKDVAADGITPLYKMWYSGHDRSYWRIYHATSPDGLNWTKYDNSVPAASDTIGTNGRIPLGTGSAGDKTATYAPTVVKDTSTTPPTYKMWYSGYDGSYWRVYYATSTDGGLTWTKLNTTAPTRSDTSGSNGQIPLGNSASGKGDDFYAYWPHVLWEGGQNYTMWYTGYNASGANDPTPRMYRIFQATSSDGGLTWTKRDNAMRAASDTVSGNYQVVTGSPQRGDSFGAMAPFVLKEGAGSYTMWYAGMTEGGTISIYRATTADGGGTWTKQDNTIPPRSDAAGTNGRVPKGANAVIGDTMHAVFPSVIKDDATHYRMWYTGYDGANWRIFHATSADGLAWNKLDNSVQGVLDTAGSSTNGRLSLGSAGKGDSYHVYTPNVIKESANSYKMWYDGHDGINPRGIYLATSPDGLAWTKVNNSGFTAAQDTGAAPGGGRLFIGTESPSTIGDCRQLRLGHGSVVWEGGSSYRMWYAGFNGSNWRIYLATSSDGGMSWVKTDNTIPAASGCGSTGNTCTNGRIALGLAGSGDSNGVGFPMVVKEDATHYRMWYAGADGSGIWRIYHATSADGLTWTKQDTSIPSASDGSSINGRISVGNEGKGDSSHIQGLYVLKDGAAYRTWYLGYDQVTLQRQRTFHAVQGSVAASLNDNLWHSFSLPVSLKSNLSTADAAKLRIQCGITRDNGGTDGLVDTANFDMIQLVPSNQAAFNLTATKVSESQTNLTWSDMTTDESGYRIWRCKDPDQVTACTDYGATPIATVAAGATSFTDSQDLQPNTTYRYRVTAFKNTPGSCGGGWESSTSNNGSAKTDDAAPVSLTARAVATTQVDLSWTDKSLGESGFAIERSSDGVTFAPLSATAPYPTLAPVNTRTFSDASACPSTFYSYRVLALNRGLSMDGGRAVGCSATGDGWTRRKHLNITGFQPQFPTMLYIGTTAGMKGDFSDIRFYDATARKELPYYIESINGTPAVAKVWVKTGDNNNIDMYYGNTYASSASSPNSVFELWEDFSGSTIDTAKWNVVNSTGLSVSNGYLHGTSTTGQIKSLATFAAGKVLEYKAKTVKWADNPWYIGGFLVPAKYLGWVPYYTYAANVTFPQEDGRGLAYYRTDGYMYHLGYNFSYNTTDFPTKKEVMSAESMLYRVATRDAANIALHIDNLDRLDAQFKPLMLTDVASAPFTYATAPVVIGGSVANPGEAMQVDWDWVRVRPFAANEPTVTLDFEVTSSSLTPPLTCFAFDNQWGTGATSYPSNVSTVTTPSLVPPVNLTATEITPTRIDLNWGDTTGSEESGFEIQDCGAGCTNTTATPIAVPANTTTYSFTSLSAGTDHCYRVRAVKSGVCGWPSSYSPPACVSLSNTIHLDATAQGPFAVKLDWDNVPNDNRGFQIEKKLVNGSFVNIATVGNVLTYTDKAGIDPLKSYTYRVRKSDKASRTVFSDSFACGFNSQLWTADAGQSWRVPDPLAQMSNNALVTDSSNGTGTLTAAPGKLEFSSVSKGTTGTVYEAISLNNLEPVQGDFDVQLEYAITKTLTSATQNTNSYVILRYDTYAPAGYQYKITLYRARIKDTDNVMKDAYVAQYTEVVPNTTYRTIIPTADLSGKLRIARTTGSDGTARISLYTSSSGGAWDLRKEFGLKSAQAVPTWLSVQQQLAAGELAGAEMKAEVRSISLSTHQNVNPYSNEAQAVTRDANGNIIATTTPAFTAGDGDCTCTIVDGVTVCTPGRAP